MAYGVMVADNFHYMDPDEIYRLGDFSDAGAAIEACRRIVDKCLESVYRPGMSAGELCAGYTCFGEDPFIVCTDLAPVSFSAWDYARERCAQICGGQ
jgi:hypothetical protein